MHRHPHILNASTNLLGICFVIIGGLKLTGMNPRSYADEIAWIAALLLFLSAIIAYLGLRNDNAKRWHTCFADWLFLGGIGMLMCSVVVGAIFL